MNFVAVAIVSVIALGRPFNKRTVFLIGLNRILLCLNHNSQITKIYPELASKFNKSPPSMIYDTVPLAQL